MLHNRIQRITTNLWFDNEAEGAAKFYTSIFDNSRITRVVRYGHERHERGSEGAVMTVEFELEGQKYVALNGSPQRGFTEAIAFIVSCESQEEIDYYWEKRSDGGEAQVGGWLKDKFGVSWQVIPAALYDMVSDEDSKKVERVMKVLLQTRDKIDMQELIKAYQDE